MESRSKSPFSVQVAIRTPQSRLSPPPFLMNKSFCPMDKMFCCYTLPLRTGIDLLPVTLRRPLLAYDREHPPHPSPSARPAARRALRLPRREQLQRRVEHEPPRRKGWPPPPAHQLPGPLRDDQSPEPPGPRRGGAGSAETPPNGESREPPIAEIARCRDHRRFGTPGSSHPASKARRSSS